MGICKKCNVRVSGSNSCPLCQSPIVKEGEEVFPYIEDIYSRYKLFFKILLLIAFISSLICVFIDTIIKPVHFCIYVIAGWLCLLIILKIALSKRYNIPKSVIYQTVVISILLFLWDYFTGFLGWSISYAIPIICIVGSLDILITALIMHKYIDENLIYLICSALIGLVPNIFLYTNIVSPRLPSLICVFLNVLSFGIILVLKWEVLKEEFIRRFHI